MGKIKLSRNDILQQIRRTRAIKDEIDKIIRETSNTYSTLSRVSEVSTWLARRDLDNVRVSATKASRELGNLCISLNNAIRLYDEKEKEINSTLKNKISNNKRYQFVRDQFTEYLGGTAKWDKKFLEDMVNGEGIKLFNKNSGDAYKKNINKFKNSKFETLIDAINNIEDGLTQNIPQKMLSGAKNGFLDGINIVDDFKPSSWKNAKVSTKVSQGIGALGTVATVVDNLDNFKNNEGEIDINVDNSVDFVVDVGVDLGVGAGVGAIGGAVGSLILPPLGTAVGMVVGVAAGVVLNTEWIGDPPKSPVDYIKDGANKIADVVTDGIGDLCTSIGNKLNNIFW